MKRGWLQPSPMISLFYGQLNYMGKQIEQLGLFGQSTITAVPESREQLTLSIFVADQAPSEAKATPKPRCKIGKKQGTVLNRYTLNFQGLNIPTVLIEWDGGNREELAESAIVLL